MSVKKVTSTGNRVVFEEGNCYIEDIKSGEKIWLREEGGMFMLKMWVKSDATF